MPCNHKFLEYLSLERIQNFNPETLIVGTFNPQWPEENYAEWFYGRTRNNYFWDILPRMFGDPEMRGLDHLAWKNYCRQRKIAITDLLACIEDADETSERHRKTMREYADLGISTKFRTYIPNDIVSAMKDHSTIKAVYLTTTNVSSLWKRLWQPVSDYCGINRIWCQKLMTPSKGARYNMKKGSGMAMADFIYNDWIAKWYTGQGT